MHSLLLRNRQGTSHVLHYDEEKHALFQNGECLEPDMSNLPMPHQGRTLRISLGKRCNFRCAYCLQGLAGDRRASHDVTEASALDALVEALRPMLEKQTFDGVQFWGGEPLVYFNVMQYLHEKISKLLGTKTKFGFCTNGSLLYGERMQWILDNHISVSLSWDGDGQHLRGEDPLRSPRTRDNIRELFEQKQCSLSPVLTRESGQLGDIIHKAKKLLGIDAVSLSDLAFLVAHDDMSAQAALPENRLRTYAAGIHRHCLSGELDAVSTLFFKAVHFLRRLNSHPVQTGETACFASSDNVLTVDLRGNILTCQNFEASSKGENGETYCLGNIFGGMERRRPNLRALKKRQQTRCLHCPARQICKGGCPYWPAKYVDYNCRASLAQAMPVLGIAMHMLTGDVLTRIIPLSREQ